MYYTRQNFIVDGELQELKIPILDIDRTFVSDSDSLFTKSFKGFNNIKVQGIYKGEIVSPFPEYYPNRPLTNVILPIIEPTENDIDATPLIKLYMQALKSVKAPLFMRDDVEYVEEEDKFIFTRNEDNLYFNRFMNIIDIETDAEEEEQSESETEVVTSFTREKDTIRTCKFVEYGLGSEVTLRNIISYDVLTMKAKLQRLGKEQLPNLIKATLSEPYFRSLYWLVNITNKNADKVNVPGIIDQVTSDGTTRALFRAKCGENVKVGGFINPSKPYSYSTVSPLLRLLEGYFKYLRYIEDRIFINMEGREVVGNADVGDIYIKSRGIPYVATAMLKEDDTLLVPLLSFSEIQEIAKDVNQVMITEKANGRSGMKEELIMLESLDSALEITQDRFAFPYKRKEQFMMDFDEYNLSDKEMSEVIGQDENNDAGLFENEEIVSTNLMILLKNLLYEESNKSMTEDEYFEHCVENKITSQTFIRYMAVACSQVANITWAHTGLIPVKPRAYWYTQKGWEYRQKTGKVSLQETYRYDDSKSITDEEADECHLFTPNRSGRMRLGTGSRIPVMGEFKILRALEQASKTDIMAPILAFIRFCRWGSRKPTKIKLGEDMYFQPYNGEISKFKIKGEEVVPDLAEGVDGILANVICYNVNFAEGNSYGLPSGSYKLPLGVGYAVPYVDGTSKAHVVDLITLVNKGLNLKGFSENKTDIDLLDLEEVLQYELEVDLEKSILDICNSLDLLPISAQNILFFLYHTMQDANYEEGSIEEVNGFADILRADYPNREDDKYQSSIIGVVANLIYKKNAIDIKKFIAELIRVSGETSDSDIMKNLVSITDYIRKEGLSYNGGEKQNTLDSMIQAGLQNPFAENSGAVSNSFASFTEPDKETVVTESTVVEPEVVEAEVVEPEVIEPEVVEAEVAEPEVVEAEIKTGEFEGISGRGEDVVISKPSIEETHSYTSSLVSDVNYLTDEPKEADKEKSTYVDGLGRADINELFEEGGLEESTKQDDSDKLLEKLNERIAELEMQNSKLTEEVKNITQVKDKLAVDNKKLQDINSKLSNENHELMVGKDKDNKQVIFKPIEKDGRYNIMYAVVNGERGFHIFEGVKDGVKEYYVKSLKSYTQEERASVSSRNFYGTQLTTYLKTFDTLGLMLMDSIVNEKAVLYFSDEGVVLTIRDMLKESGSLLLNNKSLMQFRSGQQGRDSVLNDRQQTEQLIRTLLKANGISVK